MVARENGARLTIAVQGALEPPGRQGIFLSRRDMPIDQGVQPMAKIFRSSRPDGWIQPRPYRDATYRYMSHGPILPMEEPGFLARLFGRY